MKVLNNYLYDGDTVFKILQRYSKDLKDSAKTTGNQIDMVHCNFIIQIAELLQHNEFLTSQSQRIREFYQYMSKEYPFLSFTFKGRIKSLIRAEEKFNGFIVEYIYDFYQKQGEFPSISELKKHLNRLRDLIAYRIVISLPKCNLKEGQNKEEEELKYLYEIANYLPVFLEERGFSAELSTWENNKKSHLLNENIADYYKDYVHDVKPQGYRSLHITFYDNSARCNIEIQLRTKTMDDFAEIGPANHLGYEKRQESERSRRSLIPEGKCIYFDEAFKRLELLQELDLSKIDVNMFAAINDVCVNDGCGLYKGRLILPYEHLSRFQK
ncbi:MAG: guanosine polyphosphate pyrophosphohydrolase [Lachnospiraceae bacterium]